MPQKTPPFQSLQCFYRRQMRLLNASNSYLPGQIGGPFSTILRGARCNFPSPKSSRFLEEFVVYPATPLKQGGSTGIGRKMRFFSKEIPGPNPPTATPGFLIRYNLV